MQARPPVDLDQRVQTICLLALTLVVVAIALYLLRPVLVPFVLAVFFAYALMPIVDFLQDRARLPRPLAVPVTLLFGVSAFIGTGAMVTRAVRQISRNASTYQERFVALTDYSTQQLSRYGLTFDDDALNQYLASLPIGDTIAMTANTLLDTVSNTFIALVFGIYIIFGYRRVQRPPDGLRATIDASIKRYIITKVIASAATGTGVFIVLAVLGVDLALVFGVIAFLLNFIPTVGSIIATLLPMPVVLMSDATTSTAVLAFALPLAIQTLIGNFIEPKIMGDALQLHPITVLLSLILWGVIWGVPGMFLAVPMTAVFKIMFTNMPFTRPFGELLAGDLDPLLSAIERANNRD